MSETIARDKTILGRASALREGRTSARTLTLEALARIRDPQGEGSRTFLSVDEEGALKDAERMDEWRRRGIVPSPLAGLPVAIKDLFDIAGQVTTAGSKVLTDQPPAVRDAPVVARLRAAGAILIGRTNMVEFAYGGLGLNPHYGTPGNPFDRSRVPGGSSSGAGVAVADEMAVAALATDTGGSIRIPAAYCGLVGFKPTARRIPLTGGVPLSTTLDSYGPIAHSVRCCAIMDAILAGEEIDLPAPPPLPALTFGVVANYVLEDVDPALGKIYQRALDRLVACGARLQELTIPALNELPGLTIGGGFTAAEAYAWHRPLLARRLDYDPRVIMRMEIGAKMSAVDYLDLLAARARIQREVAAASASFDALLMPTVAQFPPLIQDCMSDEGYRRHNLLTLRNTAVGNFLDRCALSLPMQARGELPAGLMLMGESLQDRRLLAVGMTVEAALQEITE